MKSLPVLASNNLNSNRDYLQGITLALSSLQRGFIPKHPKYWDYGLEVTMRGICTQSFKAGDKEYRALIDLVKNKIRFDDKIWDLEKVSGRQLFEEFRQWAEKFEVELEEPKFAVDKFDAAQSKDYAEALWWMQQRFTDLKKEFKTGSTAPVFLYPHHFDLALAWFPWDDKRQISIGFSTGDENVKEPYIYLTVYPEPDGVASLMMQAMPADGYWHAQGFSGGVLKYADLQQSDEPAEKLHQFVAQLSTYAVANGF